MARWVNYLKVLLKLVETINDVEKLKIDSFKKPLAYITQTTLSVDDTAEIIIALKNKFPNIKEPIKEDICLCNNQ